ncbi:hypothetical protein Sste5346_005917 [Sporothrix stenoceras]|uniref:Uncharacterized protein n=1 Tax=Sporothrix stenoceras TaxID=5173 RepID=A0ABR3Z1A5_9PEZI
MSSNNSPESKRRVSFSIQGGHPVVPVVPLALAPATSSAPTVTSSPVAAATTAVTLASSSPVLSSPVRTPASSPLDKDKGSGSSKTITPTKASPGAATPTKGTPTKGTPKETKVPVPAVPGTLQPPTPQKPTTEALRGALQEVLGNNSWGKNKECLKKSPPPRRVPNEISPISTAATVAPIPIRSPLPTKPKTPTKSPKQ